MAKLAIKLVEAPLRNVHVIDGDTVDGTLLWWHWFTRSEIQTRVRLAGIDAPEMKPKPEPFAKWFSVLNEVNKCPLNQWENFE